MPYKKLIGFNNKRLSETDKDGIPYSIQEKQLVDKFNTNQSPGAEQVLNMIIKHPRGYLTHDEAMVAMSMLQWFGTSVGRAFHTECMQLGDAEATKLAELGRLVRKTKKEQSVPFSVQTKDHYFYDNGENQLIVKL